MPLIIAVLIVIVLIVSVKESKREDNRKSRYNTTALLKTNASLEREIMDSFIKRGIGFNEAFDMAVSKIVELGYEPCIPKTAYKGDGSETYYSSIVIDVDQYNSAAVRHRLYQYNNFKKKMGHFFTDAVTYDEYVYDNFYTCSLAYDRDKNGTLASELWALDDYVVNSRLGTCKVVGYVVGKLGIPIYYQIKVLKTGEIITSPCLKNNMFVRKT